MDPYEALLDIERNSKAHAVIIPQRIDAVKDWAGVGFIVQNTYFVCPLKEIAEIHHWPKLTLIPRAKKWLRGITNLRGHLLPVTDLQGFVNQEIIQETKKSRILIVEHERAAYGFAVEQTLGIQRFFLEDLKPVDRLKTEMQSYVPFIQGIFERKDSVWMVLSLRAIVQTPEFYHIMVSI